MGDIHDPSAQKLLQLRSQSLIVKVGIAVSHLRCFVTEVPLIDMLRHIEVDHARTNRVPELMGLKMK
jgi:hypothetical protein